MLTILFKAFKKQRFTEILQSKGIHSDAVPEPDEYSPKQNKINITNTTCSRTKCHRPTKHFSQTFVFNY
jgi:hypothetical protein